MASKRSCFNPTLMYRDLRRFWPCWAVTLVTALLLLPVSMASLFGRMSQSHQLISAANAAGLVCGLFTVVITAAAALGILVACLVSRHLFSARSVNFFHALPIRREGLLITNIVTGIVMLWGPILLTALVTLVIELSYGVFDPVSLGQLLLAYLCSSTLFFAMGLMCCHVTGMAVSAVGLYVILNCLFYLGPAIVSAVLSLFLVGYTGTIGFRSAGVIMRFLTPYSNILSSCRGSVVDNPAGEGYITRLANLDLLLLYAAVGVALMALTLLLYRHRRSERAGDLLAFGWLRPVFKVCVSVLGGMALTVFLLALYGLKPGFLAVVLLCVLWSLVCWIAAEMLVRKSVRVFHKRVFVQWGLTAACCVLLLAGMRVDLFGIERRVPQAQDLVSASIMINGRYASVEDPEQMQKIIDLHQTLVDHREQLRQPDGDTSGRSVDFDYSLSDSISTIRRSYHVPDVLQGQTPNEYQQALYDLLSDPDMVMQFYFDGPLSSQSEVHTATVGHYTAQTEQYESLDLTQDQAWQLYQAIEADIYDGNLLWAGDFYPDADDEHSKDADWYTNTNIELLYGRYEPQPSGEEASVALQRVYLDLNRGMEHTIAVLESFGLDF